ncbi:MAG TPA: hypothetical protein VLL97_03705 [Acidobacteriota bacterium]|nr:hypothetical protein [Acidobacteriota bacterium]
METMPHWQLLLLLIGLIAAWSGIILGVMRTIITKCVSDLEDKISDVGQIGKDYQRIEKALLELRAELPIQYVRREDQLRDSAVIYIKIDKLTDKIDGLQNLIISGFERKE